MLQQLEGYDRFVHKTMKDMKVQGTAIAVVQDGQVVHCQGYGLRDVKNQLPVDSDTVFAIGSASKAFTTLAMGILVDRGLLEWDRPVRSYMPDFKLVDPFATERMTPRDLVCHRSGLPRHDLMWYGSKFSRKEIVDRLQYLEPNKDFRTYLQYQNLMFLTAGYLMEVVSGKTWEDLLKDDIFTPLGMTRSSTTVDVMPGMENAARPYREMKKKVNEIPYRNIDAVGPAGSVNASLNDMVQWVLLHLNGGKVGDKEVISATNLGECHRPNMVITGQFFGALEKFPEYDGGSYGLGWFVSRYRGKKLIHHGGNIDGFSSLISFMPDENIGVVQMTNMDGTPLTFTDTFAIYDRLLGLEPVDWHGRMKQIEKENEAAGEAGKEKAAEKRVKGTKPSHTLTEYIGKYEHPGYGIMTVAGSEKGLTCEYNELQFEVKHYHYDVFELYFERFEMRLKAIFATDAQGKVISLSVPLEPSVKDIVFTRLPDEKLSDPGYIAQFAGDYELMGQPMAVALRGDTLFVTLPGQPEVELLPYEGSSFKVKNAPAVMLEFVLENGKVTRLDVNQGGMVFQAARK